MSAPSSVTDTASAAAILPETTPGNMSQSTMDFYNLLTTQLTNQNPLEPMKETEFLGQMAQFSTVEQLEALNGSSSKTQAEQRWLSAQDYLDRKISWKPEGSETEFTGTVERIDRDADGEIWLHVGDEKVGLSEVTTVAPGIAPKQTGDSIR